MWMDRTSDRGKVWEQCTEKVSRSECNFGIAIAKG
jgi:hypothetical protein